MWVLALLAVGLGVRAVPAAAGEKPEKGALLPAFEMPAPAAQKDLDYLGVTGPRFTLSQVAGSITLVEVLGVYCPRCHEQAPLFHSLYARLAKGALKDQVKMLGIAAGATNMEVDLIRKEWKISHPVIADEKFELHKVLGEPRTPFTLLVDKDNRVLFAQEGVIKDMDRFYQTIKDLLP
jgi:hypothetical protein